MNELTHPGPLDYGAIRFDQLNQLDFVEVLKSEIIKAEKELAEFEYENKTDFDGVFGRLSQIDESIGRINSIFHNLYALVLDDKLSEISPEISKLSTNFFSKITLSEKIFLKIKACFDTRHDFNYNNEQLKIIESEYRYFVRNGALLNAQDKEKLNEIDLKLSELSLKFNENTIKATNKDFLHITNQEDLEGLPESSIESALAEAGKRNLKGWVFTLQAPSYFPFVTYAKNRELRRELSLKAGKKNYGGEFDNTEIIKETLTLRFKRAKLLGYESHAAYVLEERMAKKPSNVYDLLNKLKSSAVEVAKSETDDLKKLMKAELGTDDLRSWDVSYYAEKQKMLELKFNDEEVKPYFKLENVVSGVFKVAELMYGLRFKSRPDLPVYHPEVKVFEVFDNKDNSFIGLFYTDYFPRSSKGGGAWCSDFTPQGYSFGKVRRPHVINVGNFNPSTKTKPSLLNFNEVLTLFHEFGHALHVLLSNCEYRNLSGTNVHWDFVELPSQIMENWCYQKECLDLFAKHHETGELIPTELVGKLKRMNQFRQGTKILRQVKFALLDMSYHDQDPKNIKDIEVFEKNCFKDMELTPFNDGTSMSTSFGHLFAGGYSAGYYSYHWAEVLDADAFEYFLEHGIFNAKVAEKFRNEILSKGGTENPEVLYKNFRGLDPNPDALLKRSGLH